MDVDLALNTSCFQAFFKLVEHAESLEQIWKALQEKIARYKSEEQHLPRDLYLTFLLLDTVPSTLIPVVQTIAADPLVCRKIVVATSPDRLGEAVGSLPFVSMGTGLTRPSPALPDILSAFAEREYPVAVLDLLSERASAERILARLLELPIPSKVPHVSLQHVTGAQPHAVTTDLCRLNKLSIKNFRGIQSADLDLSASITVIYGQNGTGKTSIFDALEWLLVGGVERLEIDSKDDISGRSPYVNLFSKGAASVSAEASFGQHTVEIMRTCDSKGQSSLAIANDRGLDDREAMTLVVGEQSSKLDARVLRRLIRTTSFLSQSTLKHFLSESPTDRYWSLAHLLGTQDYVRLLDRIDEVRKHLDRRNHELSGTLEMSAAELSSLSAQVKSREALLSNSSSAQDLDKSLTELLSQTSSKLDRLDSPYTRLFSRGYSAYDAQSSVSVALDWADVQIRQEKLLAEKLTLAADAAKRKPEILAALSGLSGKTSELQAALENANQILSNAEQMRSRKQIDLETITKKLERLRDQHNQLREATVITGQLAGLNRLRDEQQQQLSVIEAELAQATQQRAAYVEQLSAATARQHDVGTQQRDIRERLSILEKAEGMVATYSQLVLELPSLQQRSGDSAIRSAEQQKAVSELRARIAAIQQEISSIALERERQLGSAETLRSLLANIQQYVSGSDCPLCGTNWDSNEALKGAINARMATISPRIIQLNDQLQQMQQRLAASQDALTVAEQEQSRIEKISKEIEARSHSIQENGIQLRALLARADISASSDVTNVRKARDAAIAELTRVSSAVALSASEVARLRDQLSQLESETNRKQEIRQRMAMRLAETQRRANDLLTQLAMTSVAEGERTTLQNRMDVLATEIDAAEKSRNEALRLFTEAESGAENYKVIVADAKSALSENDRQISSLNDSLARIHGLMSEAQIDSAANSEEINARAEYISSKILALDDLRTTVLKLQQISSWLLARRELQELQEKISSMRQNTEGLSVEVQTLSRWYEHLSTLYVALLSIKAEVENLQLEKYAPTINLLYQRLNTHPLFTELRVEVDAKSQSVRVQVKVPSSVITTDLPTGLAPANYLSEAQMNIVALSIFLSHSYQQRWSRFVPLFLDDPVQNMDNFNANGFVDCLRSLAGSERQFVVSTCDIGLYRLLLLKLRCMNQGESTRFRAYRLEGISEVGPMVIEDLPTTSSVVAQPVSQRVQ